jgi:hypothetical protein
MSLPEVIDLVTDSDSDSDSESESKSKSKSKSESESESEIPLIWSGVKHEPVSVTSGPVYVVRPFLA